MLIFPHLTEIKLQKGMSVSRVEIDVSIKHNKKNYTYAKIGMYVIPYSNQYTYTNNTPLVQKVYKGANNLYIA